MVLWEQTVKVAYATALAHGLVAWRGAPGLPSWISNPDQEIFTAIPQRQGDLRALTECFPGDKVLSQSDEEWFSLRTHHRSIPTDYLLLKAPKESPWTKDEIRNRWLELDQAVRDAISKELNFQQYPVKPSIGLLWEYRYGEEVRRLTKELPDLYKAGVRQILLHNPGWINGGSLRRGEDGMNAADYMGGGNCNVYDWDSIAGHPR